MRGPSDGQSEWSRRAFFAAGAAMAGSMMAGMTGRQVLARQQPAGIAIGIQLHSLRAECARDGGKGMQHVIQTLAAIGYEAVEFAGFFGWEPADLRKLLDDHNMKAFGSHTPMTSLEDERLNEVIETHQILGARDIIVPAMSGRARDVDDWRKIAEQFNEIARRLRPHGMRTGYHNVSYALRPIGEDGLTPWDVVFQNVDDDVIMQLDMGNAMISQADPVQVLQQYPGRGVSLHMKEHNEPNGILGRGEVDWPSVIQLARTISGTQRFIVEHERRQNLPGLEISLRCFQQLKSMAMQGIS